MSLPPEDPFTSICTVSFAGKPLEIRARCNPPADPMQLGGACEAVYAGQQRPCRVGCRHVQIHWFAYIDDPLGLDQTQLDALRRRYLVENLPEEAILRGVVVVPLATSLVVFLLVSAWLWLRRSTGIGNLLAAAALSRDTGIALFVLAGFLTGGLWDGHICGGWNDATRLRDKRSSITN
ncbi:MAG: hypothetical protein R6W76_06600 [Caldilinea sp.]